MSTRPRVYDPVKHGRATVYTGVCATARVEGTVDGHEGRPGSGPGARVRKYHGLARQVYIDAYREHARPGQQLALF